MQEGDQVGGFTLIRVLGTGLGGETWLCEQEGKRYAAKIVKEGGRLKDLLQEAMILRDLKHPNVVRYCGVVDPPGSDWAMMVTEYVEGGDLDHHVRARGAYAPREVARLGAQVAEALEAVHQRGVLHRDLKPGNILVIERSGRELPRLQLADFGVSRELRDGLIGHTRPVASPGYAAPEQYTLRRLTKEVDIYGLGAVLWFLAVGHSPKETDAGLAGAGLDLDARGKALDALIARMMALDPRQRPELGEVRVRLRRIITGQTGDTETYEPEPLGDNTTIPPLDDLDEAPASLEVDLEPPVLTPPPRSSGPLWAIGGALLALGVGALWVAVEQGEVSEVAPPTPAVVGEAPEPVGEVAKRVEQGEVEASVYGVLRVGAQPDATVWIDGTRYGTVGKGGMEFSVPVGRHSVRLVTEGGTAKILGVTLGEEGAAVCWSFRRDRAC